MGIFEDINSLSNADCVCVGDHFYSDKAKYEIREMYVHPSQVGNFAQKIGPYHKEKGRYVLERDSSPLFNLSDFIYIKCFWIGWSKKEHWSELFLTNSIVNDVLKIKQKNRRQIIKKLKKEGIELDG